MRKFLSVILIIGVFSVFVFAIDISEILQKWEESEYKAERLFLEKYEDEVVRMRYEVVYKWTADKLVQVDSPRKIIWFRSDYGCWMGDEVLYYIPLEIKDLEDIALEAAYEATDIKLEKVEDDYILEFSADRGNFLVKLNEDFLPILIKRELVKLTMEMEYKEYYDEVPEEEETKKEYRFSDKKAFSEEIARILKKLEWFSIEEEPNSIRIKGVYRNRIIDINIAPMRKGKFRKFGKYFIFSKDKEFMDELLGQ